VNCQAQKRLSNQSIPAKWETFLVMAFPIYLSRFKLQPGIAIDNKSYPYHPGRSVIDCKEIVLKYNISISMVKSLYPWTRRPLLASCVVAAISVGIAAVITLKLESVIEDTAILFLCAVMLSSWYGGLWPGVLAALLSVLVLDYYFIPPLYALGLTVEEGPDMIVFVATALFISWLSGEQKQAKESLRQARDELEAKVQERTTELKRANQRLQAEIADRESAEEGLIQAQAENARIARITTMGELVASIAHELNQPLGGIVTSGDACLRWLTADPPNLDEVRQAVQAIIRDGTRASDVLVRIRGLLRRGERLRERSDINDIVREVIALSDGELRRNGASVRTEMSANLPAVVVDRVLLRQVILNLMMNAVEAMRAAGDRAQTLGIRTEEQPSGSIVVLVKDSGVGLDPKHSSRIFEAFYTTKVEGIGMGLTISRSIIEAHGGRLWAVANDGPGSTFCFRLPIEEAGIQ
jgi:signal transduction histidine kinase